jgi:phosphoglycolate phosphatase
MATTAVIFDLDGTLVDTAPDLMAATNHVLARMERRPITMTEVRAFVGHGAKALISRGAAATGDPVDEATLAFMHAEFLRFYAAHIADSSFIFPGVEALLEALSQAGVKLGVCTNKLEGLSVQLLEELKLSRFFGAIIGPDTINVAKPDPAPYQETLRRLGIASAERSVMIGDSETDILTARAAGAPVIAVPFGYTPRPVASYNPDYLIAHYDEALPLLRQLAIL